MTAILPVTEALTLALQARIVRNDDQELFHQLDLTITTEGVTVKMAGYGPGCAAHPPITSADPAVIAYFRQLDAALQATAYVNRPLAQ